MTFKIYNSKKHWLIILMLLTIIVGCQRQSNGNAGKQKVDNENNLRIGVIFPLTGDAASYGDKGRKAIELSVDEINSSVSTGMKVSAIFEDSRAEPKMGVAAIKKLIDVNKVSAVVGDIVSAVTLPAAPIAESNKVLLMAPTSSAPALTNAGDYIYRIWPSDLVEGTAIATFAIDHGYRSAAILHLNNDYGQAIADIFKKTFEGKGGKVLLNEGYLANATDFRTVLAKIKNAKPDVIYVAGYYADTSVILKQAKELAIKAQFLGTTAIEDDKFLELAGTAAEGIIYPLATGFDPASNSPVVQAFVKAFETKYGYKPGWVEAHCYDAFKLVYTAASQVKGPINGTQIKDKIDQMGEYKGVTGIIKFDKNGDVIKPVVFKIVKNGKFQPFQ